MNKSQWFGVLLVFSRLCLLQNSFWLCVSLKVRYTLLILAMVCASMIPWRMMGLVAFVVYVKPGI